MEHPDTYPFPDTISPEPWTAESASCRSVDPELFFPEPHRQTAREAIAICNTCPLKVECLQAALDADRNQAGVWGGTTERERRSMRKARPRVLACTAGECSRKHHAQGYCKWHYDRLVNPRWRAS